MKFLRDRAAIRSISNKSSDWYQIRNASAEVAEVIIYGEIGFWGVTAEEFISELKEITAPKIRVRINSPGGSVFDSVAIYNTLRTHPAAVTTQVDAVAASGASIIAQAGAPRIMLSHSQMMIHEAHGLAIGGAGDMREFADLLDKQTEIIADIYAEASGDGRSKPRFKSLMEAETWFTDVEAVDAGLADEVVSPKKDDPESKVDDPEVLEDPGSLKPTDFSDLFAEKPLEEQLT